MRKPLLRFANNKEKYYLVHPCRLISSFVIHVWTVSHPNLLQVKFNFSSKYLQLSRDWFNPFKNIFALLETPKTGLLASRANYVIANTLSWSKLFARITSNKKKKR